ncbi:MAG: serine--tRNA ligase [Candidatus Aenigmarchaeota archaeon]|nr:serine--tRNA ligase [Candidatus Aenigmarchaeota archaeon]
MLDINLIRNNKEVILNDLKKRGDKDLVKTLDEIIELDKRHNALKKQLDGLKHKRNTSSREISELIKQKKTAEAQNLKKEVKTLSEEIKEKDKEELEQSQELRQLMLLLPNVLHKSVPTGKDDSENLEIRKWGKIKKYDFPLLSHIELGEHLDLFDLERAAKVAGARFYYLKNDAVKLEFALISFAIDFLKKKGFTLMTTPMLIKKEVLEGAGFLPSGAEEVYKVEGEDKYLVGTSEQALCGYYSDETLLEKDLPVKICGYSSCFRTEAGSHGKDTKGIFRVHQFEKIEMFIFCHPDKSWEEHEKLINTAEEITQLLEIPYHVVNICTGDIGVVAAKKYDIEAWFPSQNAYREIVSCSNCTDYQARRTNIKYRKEEGTAPLGVVHTLNSTSIAVSRIIVAILENYQQKDKSIKIPKVLQKYFGADKIEKETYKRVCR